MKQKTTAWCFVKQARFGSFYLNLVLFPSKERVWRSFSINFWLSRVNNIEKHSGCCWITYTPNQNWWTALKGLIQKASHKFLRRVKKTQSNLLFCIYGAMKLFSEVLFLICANESYNFVINPWNVHIDEHCCILFLEKLITHKWSNSTSTENEILSLNWYISKSFYRIWIVKISMNKNWESKNI